MKRWFVVYTHAGNETMAEGQLTRQNFITYLPKYKKIRRHGPRTIKITAPLFPRYIFIELDLDVQRWRAVNSTYGVHHIVCMGDRPGALPNHVIPEIKQREANDGHVSLTYRERFNKGEVVQITGGPLADQVGMFECTDDDQRNVVLLNLLGREVPVHVSSEVLRAYV